MTKEQIKQAAQTYADDNAFMGDHWHDAVEVFIAGAESRQPEIDTLTADNERLQKDVANKRKKRAKECMEEIKKTS